MQSKPPLSGARGAYSYRADAAVPDFDDRHAIVFMDGDCALCSGAARAIAHADRRNEVRIATVQSALGRAVLTHYGLDADDPETWLYLEEGRAYVSLDGVTRLASRLGGRIRIFTLFRVLPRSARDWLYRRIARNRYRIFGRADLCALPDDAVRARLIA